MRTFPLVIRDHTQLNSPGHAIVTLKGRLGRGSLFYAWSVIPGLAIVAGIIGADLVLVATGLSGLAITAFLFSPETFLYIYVFVIALSPKLPLLEIEGYFVPLRMEDVVILLLLILVLIRRLVFRSHPIPAHFLRPVMLFMSWCAISTFWGVAAVGSVPPKTAFLYFARLVEYFSTVLISISEVRSLRHFRRMLFCVAAATLVLNVYGILQQFGKTLVFNATHMTGEIVTVYYMTGGFGADRLSSLHASPNELAVFYLLVIPCFLVLSLDSERSFLARAAFVFLFGFSLFCFYLTYMRTAALAMAVSIATVFWLKGHRRIALLVAPLTSFPVLLFQGFRERLDELVLMGSREASIAGRLQDSWARSIQALGESPLFGTGLGSLSPAGIGVDGMYFILAGMLGLPGVVAFGFILYRLLVFLRTLSTRASAAHVKSFSTGLVAGIVGLIIAGTTMDVFFQSRIGELVWFFLGSLYAAERLDAGASRRLDLEASRLGLGREGREAQRLAFSR